MANNYAECDSGAGSEATPENISAAGWLENIAGTENDITGTPETAITIMTNGLRLAFVAVATNTDVVTLDVGFGPVPVHKTSDAEPGNSELDPGDIVLGSLVEVYYSTAAGDVFILGAQPSAAAASAENVASAGQEAAAAQADATAALGLAVGAWVKCNAAGAILASYNVDSVGVVATGRRQIVFTNDAPGADYAYALGVQHSGGVTLRNAMRDTGVAPTAGTFNIITQSVSDVASAANVDSEFSAIFFW